MPKEIIVNVGERETRIAVTEEGKLVELHIERAERVVGSLYKCRVANVLQGMDAAFVDIGLERNAFLYVGDVLPTGEDSGSTSPMPPLKHERLTDRRGRSLLRTFDVTAAIPAFLRLLLPGNRFRARILRRLRKISRICGSRTGSNYRLVRQMTPG